VNQALELGRRTMEVDGGDASLFVDGTANLLGAPEFADPERVRALVRALEEKRTLIGLLNRVLADEGLQVVIGDEAGAGGLAQCSVVASTYGTADQVMGTVGIVGPMRMEYARAIALVEHLARVLSRIFSTSGA
jgi:heat-inducible transcriptional repressor